MTLKEKVEKSLSTVVDPETNLDIMRMKLVRNLSVDSNGSVTLTFRPSSPVCPMAFTLAYEIKKAVEKTEGVKETKLNIENYNRSDELKKVLDSLG
jgi:metal-sulfur cluster biosynthetic enzyme